MTTSPLTKSISICRLEVYKKNEKKEINTRGDPPTYTNNFLVSFFINLMRCYNLFAITKDHI
jgi:hypothetical protein